MTKNVLVLGAGGLIGTHLVRRLSAEVGRVHGADLKRPEFSTSAADRFTIADLRDPRACADIVDQPYDEVYQLAADKGGDGDQPERGRLLRAAARQATVQFFIGLHLSGPQPDCAFVRVWRA